MSPIILCIMGPTAVGKSALALKIASKIPAEIINVDSTQVYRGLDVGTAKASLKERETVTHHLIDICETSERYSAGNFVADVKKLIPEILSRGKTPILVGGTMLYFSALQKGLAQLPPADEMIRAELETTLEEKGLDHLFNELKKVDVTSAERIHPNDPQRIMRALEVFKLTGKPLSDLQTQTQQDLPYKFVNWIIAPQDRSALHASIEKRFDEMLAQGFLDEVKALHAQNISMDLPAMRAVGYRQALQYLNGEYDLDTMREKAIVATRQLAKRQLTWCRGWEGATWFLL